MNTATVRLVLLLTWLGGTDWDRLITLAYPEPVAAPRPIIFTYTPNFPCPACDRAKLEFDRERYNLIVIDRPAHWNPPSYPVFHFRVDAERSRAIYGWQGRDAFDREFNQRMVADGGRG